MFCLADSKDALSSPNCGAACAGCFRHPDAICHLFSRHLDRARTGSSAAAPVTVTARDVIIAAGEQPATIYMIKSGWVLRKYAGEDMIRPMVCIATPGDLLSLEFLNGRVARFSCIALSDCQLCAYDLDTARNMLRAPDEGHRSLMHHWDARVRQLEVAAALLQRATAVERVCATVLQVQSRQCILPGEKLELDFPLRMAEFASALGLTTAHLSRTLSGLREKGILELQSGKMLIRDPDKLRRIALRAGLP